MIDLTISIVTANNRHLIVDCLRSIYETTKRLRFEVYVVLNNSHDDSEAAIRENFPEVKLIINHAKMGFCQNHNLVIKRSKGKYILVLNDDTVILDGALDKMVHFMESHDEVGILGCRILNPDGSLQWSSGKSFNHKFEYFRSGVLKPLMPFFFKERHFKNTLEVSWVTGACFLVRAQTIGTVGIFDENIIIYCEDADWCYRMIQAGWKVVFFPHAEIIHYYGQTRKHYLGRDTFIIYLSKSYFFSKHYSSLTFHLVRFLTMLEAILRYMKTLMFSYYSPSEKFQKQELLEAYQRVIKLVWNYGKTKYEYSKQ